MNVIKEKRNEQIEAWSQQPTKTAIKLRRKKKIYEDMIQ